MKRFLRFAAIIAGLGGAAWLVRDRLLPAPAPPAGPAPSFRAPPDEPSRVTPSPAPRAERTADDLTEIKGIGPVYAERLAESGITSFGALATADAARLAATLDVRHDQTESWIEQAADRSAPA